MSLTLLDLTPVGGILGGTAAWAAHRWATRKDRALTAWQDALVRDEFLGHPAMRGVAYKPSFSERLGKLEGTAELLDDLFTPNGGGSVIDKINATHHLAEEAVSTATKVKTDLEHYRRDHP